jgi:alkanesulfonate monooxygenase SsuD/methylene tetrahydromethanopterin reductase-like flavin-dependent oxidoreductase (luciferase family)
MMRFGLLCSAQAGIDDAAAPPGQGLRDWVGFNQEAERLGFHSTFLVEHHFTGWGQVSSTLTMLACLAMRTTTLRYEPDELIDLMRQIAPRPKFPMVR